MKKLFTILVYLLLVACTATTNPNPSTTPEQTAFKTVSDPYSYVEKLKNYEGYDHRDDDIADNAEFDAYLTDLFVETLESDYMNMHFSIEDYKAFGITKPELTLGEMNYDFVSSIADIQEDLDELKQFDYNSLSYRQQIDYEALEYSLLESQAMLAYGQYPLLFDANTSIHSNLITNFSEFVFRNLEDVEDYLGVLADVDRYLDEAIKYTQVQANMGIALQDFTLDEALDYIDKFIAKTDDNELIVGFETKIDAMSDVDQSQKDAWKKQNRTIVSEEIIPAYTHVKEELEKLRGKSKLDPNDAGAHSYDPGYGEAVAYLKASNNQPIEEFLPELEDTLMALISDFLTSSQNEEAMTAALEFISSGGSESLNASAEEMLNFLAEMTKYDYPDIGTIPFQASYLDPSVANPNILAYYVVAPYDNHEFNVIKINGETLGTSMASAYSTLAHEGFPGHLYQNAYYALTEPNPIRSTLSFIGYTEGYAMIASVDAHFYLQLGDYDTTNIIVFNNVSFPYILQAIADLGVNALGWTKDEMIANMSTYANLDDEMASSIYESAVSGVSSIVPYGAGLAQFFELESEVLTKLGDQYNPIDFHKAILDNGPLPFFILEEVVEDFYS